LSLNQSTIRRNSIALAAGVVLNLVLVVAGARLVWLLIIGNVETTENKDAIVRVMLWESLFVVPVASVVVGGVVASVVARSAWWLGGVAILPLFIYGLITAHGRHVVLFVVYIAVAFAAAYIVSRLKRGWKPLKDH